jgi:hypothetical protein
MVEDLFNFSEMNGIWRSLCNVKFETYHGALVMVRSTFDWSLWIMLVFDGLAHPHSWIPYVQICFNMHLYIKVLFSRESLDFRPKSHDIYRTFKLSYYLRNLSQSNQGGSSMLWLGSATASAPSASRNLNSSATLNVLELLPSVGSMKYKLSPSVENKVYYVTIVLYAIY